MPALLLWLVVAVAAGVYLLLWVVAYVYPDWSWDGNAYHLPAVQLWAQRGYVHWVDMRFTNAELINGYPKGAEAVQFLLVQAFADGRLDNVANLVFLPLGVLAIVAAARALGAGRLASAAVGGAYVLLPVTINQAATTYVDSAYGSCAMAMLACLVVAWGRLRDTGRTPWQVLPALALAGGLSAAVKPVGPLMIALCLAGLGVMVLLWARAYGIAGRLGRAAAMLAAAGAISVVVGGYWYGRNLYYGGSPLYPGGLYLGGRQIFPGKTVDQLVFIDFSTPAELRPLHPLGRLAATWSQRYGWPGNIVGHDARLGGLGYLWLGGCVVAVGLALAGAVRPSRPGGFRATWLILIAISAVAVAATPMNWWARYTIWLYLLGLPCLALVLGPIRRRSLRVLRGVWLSVLALVVLAEAGISIGYVWQCPREIYLIRPSPPAWECMPQSARHGCPRYPNGYSVLMFYPRRELATPAFDAVLARPGPLGVGRLTGENRCVFGQLSTPQGFRQLLPVTDQASEHDLAELRRSGVGTVIWDASLPLPPALADLPREDLGPVLLIGLR